MKACRASSFPPSPEIANTPYDWSGDSADKMLESWAVWPYRTVQRRAYPLHSSWSRWEAESRCHQGVLSKRANESTSKRIKQNASRMLANSDAKCFSYLPLPAERWLRKCPSMANTKYNSSFGRQHALSFQNQEVFLVEKTRLHDFADRSRTDTPLSVGDKDEEDLPYSIRLCEAYHSFLLGRKILVGFWGPGYRIPRTDATRFVYLSKYLCFVPSFEW